MPKNAPPLAAKALQRVEQAFLGHHLQMGAALTARQNDAVNICEVFRTPHERVRGAETVERLGVRVVVTLNREYSDVHKPEFDAATDQR